MRGAARARGRGQARPRHKHRFDHGEPIATIDTRPIAFVALFLAVFGIIWGAGQIKTHAVTVHLPMVWGVSPEYTPSFVTIQIDEAGAVMFDGEILPLDQLAGRIREVSADYEVVLFQASPNTAFETVLRALGEIREAGIEPYDICFDPQELSAHRRFERIKYTQATTIIVEEPPPQLTMDIPTAGCAQFYPPLPAEFY
jgi:biopolymer transport protein ExbD